MFQLEVVTPESLLYSHEATMAVVPGLEGELGVLTGHSPVISALKTGILRISGPEPSNFLLRDGVVEILQERCTILADEAYDLAHFTRADAEKLLLDAKEELVIALDDNLKETLTDKVAFLTDALSLL